MSRPWDGRVREVVGSRLVDIRKGRSVRVEQLECGHELVATQATGSRRICSQCPAWDGHHAGNPR